MTLTLDIYLLDIPINFSNIEGMILMKILKKPHKELFSFQVTCKNLQTQEEIIQT